MNRNMVIGICATAISAIAFGDATMAKSASDTQARVEAKHGGIIVKPNSQKGKVAFINTQTRLKDVDVDVVIKTLAESLPLNIVQERAAPGEPAALLEASKATVAVIVLDDAKSPNLLVAPEDRWAVVNVSKLTDDLTSERAKEKFFASRARKELMRAFSLLCGGGSSQFPGNVMNQATVPELDFCGERFPVDMIDHYSRYLNVLGVTPMIEVTYRKACREGWAPAPTNDVQKAIWDKVHALPTEPIKIKPETKKVDR